MPIKIRQILPKDVFAKLANIELFYEGLHNLTYKATYDNQQVQIRIIKNQEVDHSNEIVFLKNNTLFLFIDSQGNYIKKWIQGQDLKKISNIKQYYSKICQAVAQFHAFSPTLAIQTFQWQQLDIKEPKFLLLLEKYRNIPLVLCHNDLRLKNIILDVNSNIHLIDFEWIRLNSPYFDYASLVLYCNIPPKFITNFFKIDIVILQDFIYLVKTFNDNWTEIKY